MLKFSIKVRSKMERGIIFYYLCFLRQILIFFDDK